MILLLLASCIIICLTGFAAHTTKGKNHTSGFESTLSIVGTAYADEKNERHEGKHKGRERHNLGDKDNSESDSVWSDIHEISAQFMLLLICLHIAGVAASSKMHNENLVKSMITGRKDINV
jgi:cytochrome b